MSPSFRVTLMTVTFHDSWHFFSEFGTAPLASLTL
jgi:hypothetical protein